MYQPLPTHVVWPLSLR